MTTETVASGLPADALAAAAAESAREEALWNAANKPASQQSTADKPEGVPDKFWKDGKVDTEALLASYSELEKKQGEKPAAEQTPEEKAAADKAKADADAPVPDEEIGGVKITDEDRTAWAPFYEAMAKGEALPDAAYELAKTRFGVTDRAMVDAYMKGAVENTAAKSAEYGNSVKAVAGGPEAYETLKAWAKDSLTEAEQAEYNDAVLSGNGALAKAATQALSYRMKAEGSPSVPLLGGRTAAATSAGFDNLDDMTNAVMDARYEKDAAYRDSIDKKIALSTSQVRQRN